MTTRQEGVKSKRGWLKKFMHGAFSSSWKSKYVVLGEGQLSWYASDKEGSKAERSFSVALIKFAAALESLGELPYVFEIVVGADKSYYFQARDEQELFEWLSALSRPRTPGLRKRRSVSFDASSDRDDEISPRQDPPAGVLSAVPPNPLDGAPVISPRRVSPRPGVPGNEKVAMRDGESPGRQQQREAELAARIEAELRDRFEAEVAKRVEAEMKRLSVAVFAKIEQEQKKSKKKHKKSHKSKKSHRHEEEDPAARAARKEARRRRREEEAAAALIAAGAALKAADEAQAKEKEKENNAANNSSKEKERAVKPLVLPPDNSAGLRQSSSLYAASAAPSSGPSRIGVQKDPSASASAQTFASTRKNSGVPGGARRSSFKGVLIGSEPIVGASNSAAATHTSVRLTDNSSRQRLGAPAHGGGGVSRSMSADANVGQFPRSTSVDRQLRRGGAPDSARSEQSMRRSASEQAMREKSAVPSHSAAPAGVQDKTQQQRTGLWAQASRLMIRWENFLKL